ncbi:hypothetical protein DESUT3_38570 [Desulfuromonas versatilis]|uniref:ABC transmembrane type-1 domain-containing protein n=1 Tax=Desulfuromonas versatilis TaxID=2802975 RepID=A0ABM8I1T6_9BACT|nr:ABC transporter permease subunit [Desulfuromonas versatilis]BCR06788.1 hypothetical protein DESUT3_38570 [Desulfuromonas versatilis]
MDQKVLRRVKLRDRIARWIITLGGLAIIFSVIFILVLIGEVALPLFQAPKAQVYAKFSPQTGVDRENVLATGVDEYLETTFLFDRQGVFRFFESTEGSLVEEIAVTPPGAADAHPTMVRNQGGLSFGVLWSDGSLSVEKVTLAPLFDAQGNRSFRREVERTAVFAPPATGVPASSLARVAHDGEGQTRIDLFADGRLEVTQRRIESDIFGNQSEELSTFELPEAAEAEVLCLALDHAGKNLYAGTASGALLRWDLSEAGSPELLEKIQAFDDGRRITALTLVLGDISLAVGDSKGEVTTWFPVRHPENPAVKHLQLIHQLTSHGSPIVSLLPSQRDKSVLSLDSDGVIHLDHMTSERHLLTLDSLAPVRHVDLAIRGNAIAAFDAQGQSLLWKIDNPHPEISVQTLFGKVWYESYDEPAYAWQSSSASDDFEPKLSLTPLIFGTLKGTFYAMVFAIPLALLGAIYTSQFGSSRFRQWVKPAVEVMAAIPSVVIGFLAALWFAPLLERSLTSLFLSLIFVPTAFVLAILLWQGLRRYEPLRKVERGYEFLAVIPVLLLALAAAFVLGPLFENLLFGGDFKLWLFNEMGTRYDPRNNIVIAFALGFAVIPIIFTIAEDSLSNVPPSLRAASLALGASRWQTVWRVMLPSASPGIFAGIMIGFGRAVGETMIVLMATGNTPIMDWSIFNGMRPLSSNIAVEIPEAPVGETLYRLLFFSAVILFLLTFVLNTVAEVVRQRLRKKYGRF